MFIQLFQFGPLVVLVEHPGLDGKSTSKESETELALEDTALRCRIFVRFLSAISIYSEGNSKRHVSYKTVGWLPLVDCYLKSKCLCDLPVATIPCLRQTCLYIN